MHSEFGNEVMKQKVNAQVASFILDADSNYDTAIARQMVQNVAQMNSPKDTNNNNILAESDSIVEAVKENKVEE